MSDRRISERSSRTRTARLSVAAAALAAFAACASAASQSTTSSPAPAPTTARPTPSPTPPSTIFPRARVVAYYGAADTPSMGVLGSDSIARVTPKLLKQAAAYAPYGKPVVPAFELIAVVAQADAGAYGTYSAGVDDATVQRYLDGARRMHGILILDIQPGRAAFLPLVKKYERFLREPDVSLALDSEWSMGPNEIPAQVIGGTDGATVNAVGDYLQGIVAHYHLPQKLFIVHQFTPYMIENRDEIRRWPGLAVVFHIDGFGDRPNKLSKYDLMRQNRHGAYMGFKLFYDQDTDMFSAREVMHLLHPPPDLITYE